MAATAGVRITLEGQEALMRDLRRLPAHIQATAMRQALDAGSKIAQEAIASAAPRRTGLLASDIQVIPLEKAGEHGTIVRPGKKGWYGRLVEFGTKPHKVGGKFKGAQHPGASARPWFFPAVETVRTRIDETMKAIVQAAIDAYWRSVGGAT